MLSLPDYRADQPQARIPGDVESGLAEYDDTKIAKVTKLISMMVATTAPTVSTFILYCVTNMVARLGVVTVFSGVFSACLCLFTRARKAEVFAATAA